MTDPLRSLRELFEEEASRHNDARLSGGGPAADPPRFDSDPQQARVILELLEGDGYTEDVLRIVEFGESGGDIGRDPHRGWALAHPEVSGLHAVVSHRAGQFFLKDLSTNGTYRGSMRPENRLPREEDVLLREGDEFSLAGRFLVRVAQVCPATMDDQSPDDEPEGLRGPAESSKQGLPAWAAELFPEDVPPYRPDPSRNAAESNGSEQAALARGLGFPQLALGERQLEALGALLRVLLEGLLDNLEVRRRFRAEFSSVQTRIDHATGNPLKRGDDADTTLLRLLDLLSSEDPAEAERSVQAAAADAVSHQVALLEAIHAGFDQTLGALDPDRLEKELPTVEGLRGLARSKWDRYRALHAMLAGDRRWAFQKLFEGAFCRVYDDSAESYRSQVLERLRRRSRSG